MWSDLAPQAKSSRAELCWGASDEIVCDCQDVREAEASITQGRQAVMALRTTNSYAADSTTDSRGDFFPPLPTLIQGPVMTGIAKEIPMTFWRAILYSTVGQLPV